MCRLATILMAPNYRRAHEFNSRAPYGVPDLKGRIRLGSRHMTTTARELEVTCTARSKTTGNQCRQPPIPGGTVCHYHGGNAPQVRAAALRRLTSARDKALARLTEQLEPSAEFPIDPGTLLSIVDKLTAKIELLEGRATERSESAHIRADITRQAIHIALDRVSARVQSGPVIDVAELPEVPEDT